MPAATLDQARGHLERQPAAQVALQLVIAHAELAWLGDDPVPVTVTDRVADLIDTGPFRGSAEPPSGCTEPGWSIACVTTCSSPTGCGQRAAGRRPRRCGRRSAGPTRMGVPSVPRPRSTTRTNPAGLTARQSEILHLLGGEVSPKIREPQRLKIGRRTRRPGFQGRHMERKSGPGDTARPDHDRHFFRHHQSEVRTGRLCEWGARNRPVHARRSAGTGRHVRLEGRRCRSL
jgi:hypothetical protein